ncbi:hypothetical protein Scep_009642 [Stephania cephalantha]|uniref:Protein RDM1 n=1 Tax=Stephania cephalantha TaxID=152367 RepID=A0AAP0PGG4_9MAGN
MKRSMPWSNEEILSLDSDSDGEVKGVHHDKPRIAALVSQPIVREVVSEDAVIRRAEMYQEYMRQIPIPSLHGSLIPFTSWQGLAKSIKQLYGQPLHYQTNVLLKQWDQSRIGTDDEHQPLDTIIHPCKAEATIWLIEQVHRLTTSHHHLAKLWQLDPMHHAFVDSIFPKI